MPVCIYLFDVVATTSRGDAKSVIRLVDNEDNFVSIEIEALSAYELTFAEGDYFKLPSKLGTVFIRLWVVGRRKPIWIELA